MKEIEVTGSSVNEALESGLKELSVTLDDVTYEVIGQKGIFKKKYTLRLTVTGGDAPAAEPPAPKPAAKPAVKPAETKPAVKPAPAAEKPAPAASDRKPSAQVGEKAETKPAPQTVKREKPVHADTRPAPAEPMTGSVPAAGETENGEAEAAPRKVSEEQVALAKEYLGKLLALMKIDAEIEIDTSHGSIDANIVTEDTAVIGHRGEVLDALQILTKRAVEEGDDKYMHVNVDSHGYRMHREQALVSLAQRMAEKCIRTGRKVELEPMSSTHRKIIHSTLSDNDKVVTRSVGKDPNRKVVIFPKR